MRADDYALLVGIQRYPGTKLAALQGPCNDVAHFKSWLLDPQGGDIDPQNVRELITDEPPLAPAPALEVFPPTQAQFYALFRSIVFGAGPVPIKRPQGRLYLFFSGHGFSDLHETTTHAALYCANAQPGLSLNINGTALANWCVRAAVFGEVVLVMDCCRDSEVSKKLDIVPLDAVNDAAGAKKVKKLEIYAVPFAEKAQERSFKDLGRPQGLLTYTLVSALYGAPLAQMGFGAGAKKGRSGHALKEFLQGCWPDVAGLDGPDAPEVVLPNTGDICFSVLPPRLVPRRVRLAPPVLTPATLKVVDDAGNDYVVVDLLHAPAMARVTVAGAAPVEQPFDGTEILLELRPQIYEARLDAPGAPPRSVLLPTVGDSDVVL
ncbi:MAG TPA: hypothetical protein VN811_09095 [Thermoanaerobaculia bacterium]|nr:hypothetical protein [Thermoanaerobaculia bacterium]HXT51185.1 hypothetical protein [Thermoanaerobaculia bacterium]